MTDIDDSHYTSEVLNFLEDKLRTADDLASLDALVRSMEERQHLLNTQV